MTKDYMWLEKPHAHYTKEATSGCLTLLAYVALAILVFATACVLSFVVPAWMM